MAYSFPLNTNNTSNSLNYPNNDYLADNDNEYMNRADFNIMSHDQDNNQNNNFNYKVNTSYKETENEYNYVVNEQVEGVKNTPNTNKNKKRQIRDPKDNFIYYNTPLSPDPNNLIGSNYSFEKFIKKSNSVKSLKASSNSFFKNGTINKEEEDVIGDVITNEIKIKEINSASDKNIHYNDNSVYFYNNYYPDNSSYSYNNYIKNPANSYLERRHFQEMEKINQMRQEKYNEELSNIQNKPTINYTSKLINENRKNEQTVFDRLTDASQFKKKNEEIRKIEEINANTYEPKINSKSKNANRSIQDLFEWKKQKDEKIIKRKESITKRDYTLNPNILPNSYDLLKENNPRYLEMKVEDRLLEKAQQYL